jgi:hypothetical protein
LRRSIDATVGSGVPFAMITNATTVALVTSAAIRKMMDIASPAKLGWTRYFGRLRLTWHSRGEGGSRLGK